MQDILEKRPVLIDVLSWGRNPSLSAGTLRKIDRRVGADRLLQSNRRCAMH